jgi:hypothetical protein
MLLNGSDRFAIFNRERGNPTPTLPEVSSVTQVS